MGLATTPRRLLRGALYKLGALLLIALAIVCFVIPPRGVFLTDSWQFKEKHDGPVIGNLGGMPVQVPTEFAHFVEYDGDPAFLEQRKGPAPERTPQSRIRSLGFDLLYPELLGLTPQTQSMGHHDNIYLSMWVHVSLDSGERYDGDHALRNLEPPIHDPARWKFPLKEAPDKIHGLTAYASQGGDPKDFRHVTVYTHHNGEGQLDAYIECHDAPHPAAPCNLHASMSPEVHADIGIHFRRGLLAQWADILTNAKAKILTFKHTP